MELTKTRSQKEAGLFSHQRGGDEKCVFPVGGSGSEDQKYLFLTDILTLGKSHKK